MKKLWLVTASFINKKAEPGTTYRDTLSLFFAADDASSAAIRAESYFEDKGHRDVIVKRIILKGQVVVS